MKNTSFILMLLCCFSLAINAKNTEVYPTNWWVGMKTNSIQLLIRSTDDSFTTDKININYPGIAINKTYSFPNSKYIAVDITISPETAAGDVIIELNQKSGKQKIKWPIYNRRAGNGTQYAQGVTSSDFIELIMVDRFSNGDTANDKIKGMRDQSLNRKEMYDRHGGDLQGVINNLDYIQGLGVTALWFTPVMENDMEKRTEHGYAITNHYKIDQRYGGDAMYEKLSNQLHSRGMKLIFDAVYNHIGSFHFLELDPPANDWVHRCQNILKPIIEKSRFLILTEQNLTKRK
ncbi:Beta/alpha-amylase precursor [compost metagenome]